MRGDSVSDVPMTGIHRPCPRYLAAWADRWSADPHGANLAWFAQARWGLFLHYGLYSLLGRHEWVLHRERHPLAAYEGLARDFAPHGFDAEAITDLALAAGMQYVTFTACHHEGFCLWDSTVEPFNSVRHGGRDLVRELAAACDRKGLGFFLYFTHVLNWRHPDALPGDRLPMARVAWADGASPYRADAEPARYWAWAHGCLRELCALDLPVAGIWLDLIKAWYLAPDLIPIGDTYALIRQARPEALISYKQGATGTEDFAAPEFHFASQGDHLRGEGRVDAAERADRAWALNRDKPNEICMTLQRGGWGYVAGAPHRNAEEVWGALAHAGAHGCRLLANTGPLPDGSLPVEDVATLRALGERLRREGFPTVLATGNPAEAVGHPGLTPG